MKNITMFLSFILFLFTQNSYACTNFMVTKGASADGSVITSYACDSHDIYGALYFWAAKEHPAGTQVEIIDWMTGKKLGIIPQVNHTYRVIGNMNEHQVVINESTWGGRSECIDSTAIIDVGSLIWLSLQRANNAREAIRTFHFLVSNYGYASSGESFTIADKNEVWILELISKDHGKKGAVWVAQKIPDGFISGHANQARITHFPKENKKNSISTKYINDDKYLYSPELDCIYDKDVVTYAKEMGFIDDNLKHEEFSFAAAYNPISFGSARFCEARVYAGFNKVAGGMDKYLDYALGENLENRFPLYIKPDRKIGVRDVMNMMRDYYQDTPMDMTKDAGAGPFGCTVRWRPLYWEVDGQQCFNERAISTQQTAYSIVTQSRSHLPDPVGGICWFGVDDTYLTVYTPLYAGLQKAPENFKMGNGDIMNYSETSAFWLFNRVSNFAYSIMNRVMPTIKAKQDELELTYLKEVNTLDKKANELYKINPDKAIELVSEFSIKKSAQTFNTWNNFGNQLLVTFSDGNIKKHQGDSSNYVRRLFDKEFSTPKIEQPGYSEEYYRNIIKSTGDKFKVKK
ncbi:MAG: C69 family dipeptidase [Bacteroidales bacterium]|nr:C69 family dipeptidase [Bacteroidales bacterium]